LLGDPLPHKINNCLRSWYGHGVLFLNGIQSKSKTLECHMVAWL